MLALFFSYLQTLDYTVENIGFLIYLLIIKFFPIYDDYILIHSTKFE